MSSIAAIYYRSKSQNFWLFFVILVLVLVFKPSLGQDSLRIAAVVNDQVISVFDLESRLSLLMKFSQVPNNKEARTQLAPIVLRQLIDETIKNQEYIEDCEVCCSPIIIQVEINSTSSIHP